MPKQGKTRRIAADAQRHMEAAAGDCIAWLAPPLGILMRCRVPCVRCAEQEREWQAMLPDIEAERAAHRAEKEATRRVDPQAAIDIVNTMGDRALVAAQPLIAEAVANKKVTLAMLEKLKDLARREENFEL
jgi:hypothetical protein